MRRIIPSNLLILSILTIGFVSSSFLGVGIKTSGDKTVSGDMVIVRPVEICGLKPSKMVISYRNGETETTPFKSFMIKNIGNNMDILQNELISSAGGNSDGVFVNIYPSKEVNVLF
jgi:hypothetical protein